MVRSMKHFSQRMMGSALAVGVIVAGLLWHMLACVESPMAFSPDGKVLIFSVLQPYDEKGGAGESAVPVCRLMVLSNAGLPEAKNLKALEEMPGTFITGPGFSADGKLFCYMRIRTQSPETAPATQAAGGAGGAPAHAAEATSLRLPGEADPVVIESHDMAKAADMGDTPVGQGLLVVRDAATLKVVTTALVDFTMGQHDEMAHPYLTLRPQFGPDGNVIFYTDHFGVHAVNLKDKSAAVIQRTAMCPVMSPDRKTLVFVGGGSVVMLASDLSGLTEWFMQKTVSPSGLFWINDRTLAVMTAVTSGDQKDMPQIVMLGLDGKELSKVDLPEFKGGDKDQMGELAISPDGKRMVACYNSAVRFFDGAGKMQHEVTMAEGVKLAQPAFTPDGGRVAFKELTTKKAGDKEMTQVTSIVFYDGEGKEVARVAVAPGVVGKMP